MIPRNATPPLNMAQARENLDVTERAKGVFSKGFSFGLNCFLGHTQDSIFVPGQFSRRFGGHPKSQLSRMMSSQESFPS